MKTAALAAFNTAEETFSADFKSAVESAGDNETLEAQVIVLRAVRTAYSDLGTAVRAIEMPEDAISATELLLTGIDNTLEQLDLQSAATTPAVYNAYNDAVVSAGQAVRAARESLRLILEAGVSASENPSATAGASSRPYLSGSTITDAEAWRDDLLTIGSANADMDNVGRGDYGIVQGWIEAFPGVLPDAGIVGYTEEAPPNGVSGFTVFTQFEKQDPSEDNPYFLSFAVRDSAGGCAGGVISGFPAFSSVQQIDVAEGATCSGEAIGEAAGYFR